MLYNWDLLSKEEEDVIAKGIIEGTVHGGPFHLVLSPTNRCNFDCWFCNQAEKTSELDWAVLRRVLEEGVRMGVKGLTLLGGGEPLIYPHLNDLWDLMKQHSLRLDSITTNGSPITEKMARTTHEFGIRCWTISLNETSAEFHAEMSRRSPRLFERAMHGIVNAIEAGADRRSEFEVRVQIFVWKGNFRRLIEMISRVVETGPDRVYVNTLDGLPEERRLTGAQREELKELIQEAVKRWGALLQFRLFPEGLHRFVEEQLAQYAPQALQLKDMCRTPHRIEYCYVGWLAPLILAGGEVAPCCGLSESGHPFLGNINRQSLYEIWHGEPMQQFRKEMRHLLLTGADKSLLPRRTFFIEPKCLERAACPMNFYLASPKFYHRIERWAEVGPRRAYMRRRRIKARLLAILNAVK